jgi:hypothetical protein
MKSRRPILLLLAPLAALGAGVAIAASSISLAMVQTPEPKTLIHAVADDRIETAVRLIMQGQKADRPIVLTRDLLHWRKGDTTTPFLVAVAMGRDNLMHFMMNNGVRFDVEPNDQALCVAARYGHGSSVRLLMASSAPYAPCEGSNGGGRHPGDVASRQGYKSLAKLLRTYGEQREAETSSENATSCDQATTSLCLD